jgi:Spy/CpxP family protein refolding chaperone
MNKPMNRSTHLRRSLTMLGAALIVAMATAQEGVRHAPKAHADRAEARSERMARELDLSADQAAKVQAIKDHYRPRFEKARTIEDQEQRRQTMRELKSAHDSEVRSVLTPEQDARWKALRAERATKMEQRRSAVKERHQRRIDGPRREQAPPRSAPPARD